MILSLNIKKKREKNLTGTEFESVQPLCDIDDVKISLAYPPEA